MGLPFTYPSVRAMPYLAIQCLSVPQNTGKDNGTGKKVLEARNAAHRLQSIMRRQANGSNSVHAEHHTHT